MLPKRLQQLAAMILWIVVCTAAISPAYADETGSELEIGLHPPDGPETPVPPVNPTSSSPEASPSNAPPSAISSQETPADPPETPTDENAEISSGYQTLIDLLKWLLAPPVLGGSMATETDTYRFAQENGDWTLTIRGGYAFDPEEEDVALRIPWQSNAAVVKSATKLVFEAGVDVSDLGKGAFAGFSVLETVQFASTDASSAIPQFAFESCTNLQAIELPGSITEIGAMAFRACASLSQVNWAHIKTIEAGAFEGCIALTHITAHDAPLETIGPYAFANCTNLLSVELTGGNLRTIGSSAFASCTSLQSVKLESDLSADFLLGTEAFYNTTALETFELPDTAGDLYLGGGIFGNEGNASCKIRSLVLPGAAAQLYAYPHEGNNPHDYASLEERLGGDAPRDTHSGEPIPHSKIAALLGLYDMPELEALSLTSNAGSLSVHDGALYGGTELLLYPRKNRLAPSGAVYNIRQGTTAIASYAFEGVAGLRRVSIPSTVRKISERAFYNSQIQTIKLAEGSEAVSANSIEKEAFVPANGVTLGIYMPNAFRLSPAGSDIGWAGDVFDNAGEGTLEFHVYSTAHCKTWFDRHMARSYTIIPDQALYSVTVPSTMYLHIPYRFTAKTILGGNSPEGGFVFSVDTALPRGMYLKTGQPEIDAATRERIEADQPGAKMGEDFAALPPGTIYGIPLAHTGLADSVTFTVFARNPGDPVGINEAKETFTIGLASPTKTAIASHVNAPLPRIGWLDQQINKMNTTSGHRLDATAALRPIQRVFLDGRELVKGADEDYTANMLDTTVTLTPQTIEDLTLGEHVLAVSFAQSFFADSKTGDIDVLAQRFEVVADELPAKKPADPDVSASDEKITESNDPKVREAKRDPIPPLPQIRGALPATQPAGPPAASGGASTGASAGPPTGQSISGQVPGRSIPQDAVQQPHNAVPTPKETIRRPQVDAERDANGNIAAKRGESFRVHIDIEFDQFTGRVSINGQLLEQGDFTASEGSTIIEVNKALMQKLSGGGHTLAVEFTGETVTIPFVLSENETFLVPGGAIDSNVNAETIFSVVILLSLMALAVVYGIMTFKQRPRER